jgi:hypothetical protein
MLGYRDHIKAVQKELDDIKNKTSEGQYKSLRDKKIKSLESKLSLIRK